MGLGFLLPLAALTLAGGRLGAGGLAALGLAQLAGLLAERWVFFADARHPQNLTRRRRTRSAPPEKAPASRASPERD